MEKRYITAGAGSGKTYTITTQVAHLIKEGKLKPEQVIMTTFTKVAAQELREKAKAKLAENGLHEAAQQMEHALIGTIHSVASTFLTKYWYLLGITPDATAMDEKQLDSYRNHSLKGLLNKEERNFLFGMAEKYDLKYGNTEHKSGINYEFWKKDLANVLEFMQWYGIDNEKLEDSIAQTEKLIDRLKVVTAEECKEKITDEFIQEVEEFFSLKRTLTDKQQNIKDYLISLRNVTFTKDVALKALDDLKIKITKDGTEHFIAGIATEKVKDTLNSFLVTCEGQPDDLRQYARYIFEMAQRWRKAYREYKDLHHLIDYNDMETMFLQLLDMPEVEKDIRSRYTHLYVDEFQDCSPLQVKIFQKLSSMLNTTYVGDKKQAIYGFRGSDAELTSAVADSFDETAKETLKHSYRSIEPLVNFSNSIFSEVFDNMPKDDVELKMPDENGNRDNVEKPLRLWPWKIEKELASHILQFILAEGYEPKDIAVLVRNNAEGEKLADELNKLSLPVCREQNNIRDSRTGRLMKALLTLVTNSTNQLARAEVSYLTEKDYNTTRVIEDRLEHLQNKANDAEYLQEVPIVKRLLSLLRYKQNEGDSFNTNLLGHQSISALVESLVIELDLYGLVQGWTDANAEENNLQEYINIARSYEDSTTQQGRPATVGGLLDFIDNENPAGSANENGVRVLTYHKSKGLEWKVVILASLEKDASDPLDFVKKEMLGCHYHREEQPTAKNPTPPVTISVIHNLWRKDSEYSAINTCMQDLPLWNQAYQRRLAEEARLLYVGVTRARNILVLAPKFKAKQNAIDLNWFRASGWENCAQVLTEAKQIDIFNNGINFDVEYADGEALSKWPESASLKTHDIATMTPSAIDHPQYLSPSKAAQKAHDIKVINDKEYRIEAPHRAEEDALMGNFIHQVFCCCDDGIDVTKIEVLRESYGFNKENMPKPEMLLEAWTYLTETLEKQYGKAVKHYHERPFRHIDEEGHTVMGFIDLIWETEEGYVVVDYKTCPGNYNHIFHPGEHYAGMHGAQLDCYTHALNAEGGKKVIARVIYYPITRFVVEVL